MFLLTCLALIFPAGLSEKANPLETPEHIKPEWYFLWAFRWLKLMTERTAIVTQGIFLARSFSGPSWTNGCAAAIREARPALPSAPREWRCCWR